jgi:hypothetical protein
MTQPERKPPARRRKRKLAGPERVLQYLLPLFIIGVVIADFSDDGKVDKYWIGAIVVLTLSALGYRIDTLMETYLDFKYGRRPQDDDPEDTDA